MNLPHSSKVVLRCIRLFFICSGLSMGAFYHSAGAAVQTWTGATSGTWETASNWSTALPGTGDTVLWDTPSTSNLSLTLTAAESVLGLKVGNPSGAVTLTSGTLTIGTGGIDMSAATQNLSIGSALTLDAGSQVWNVITGRTLTISGALTRSARASLLIDKSTNTGTVTASPTLTANIIGPWAIVKSSGAAANDSANGYTFATVSSGNIVAYTGATSYTATTAWGGIGNNTGSNTGNVDLSGGGTFTAIPASDFTYENTIRYTGTGATQNGGSNADLYVNGFMNAGTGTFTIGTKLCTANNNPELVLTAANAPITVNGVIFDSSVPLNLTIDGTSAVTLAAYSSFTGNVVVNGGKLNAATGYNGTVTTSALGQNQSGRTVTINNGGTVAFTVGNVLAGGAVTTAPGISFIVNPGGTLMAAPGNVGNSGSGDANVFGNITLNGGTFTTGNGSSASYQAAIMLGTVTVSGSSGSIINTNATNTTANGVMLGSVNGGTITFNVASTGANGPDLLVSAPLVTAANGATGGLNKSGAGVMDLTGVDTYNGATTIAAGTLMIGGAGQLGGGVYAGNIANSGQLIYGSSASQTLSGVISGTGTLTQTGAGTLTLSGSNTYTGATNINAGALSVTGVLGGGSGGGTVISNAANFTESSAGEITGSSSVTNTAGTATLGGLNNYTGATSINGGTLTFAGLASGPSTLSNVSVANGATLGIQTGAAGQSVLSLGANSLTFGTSSLAVDFNSLADPTAAMISMPTGTLTLNGNVALSVANFGLLTTGTIDLINYGTLAGSGSFTQTTTSIGARDLATVSNNAAIDSIILTVTADSPVWTGTGDGIWKTVTTGNNAGPNDWALLVGQTPTNYWAGDTVQFNDTYNAGAGSVAVTNTNVTIQGGVSPTSTTFNNLAVNYTVGSSDGSGIATGSLIKNGSAMVTLTSSNSYTGTTFVYNGTLQIGNGSTGVISGSSAITIATPGTLVFDETNGITQSNTIVDNGTLVEAEAGGFVNTLSGVISGSGAFTQSGAGETMLTNGESYSGPTSVNNGTLVLSGSLGSGAGGGTAITNLATFTETSTGIITGTSSFTMNSGTATLGGVNSYTGGNNISGGFVTIGSDTALGATASAVALNGATLTDTSNASFTDTHAFTIGANGAALNIIGTQEIQFATANTLLGSGTLTLSGTGGLSATGAGRVWVSATNSFSGNIILTNGGGFEYGLSNAVSSGATFTINGIGELVTENGSTLPNAITVTPNGGTLSFVNGNTGVISGPITLNGNATFALRNWYSQASVSSGTVSGLISGTGGIAINSGNGTGGVLTLTNADTYSGATTIAAGTTLQLRGAGSLGTGNNYAASITDAGAFIDNSSATQTLSGNITGGGNMTQSGAGALTLSGGGSFANLIVTGGTLSLTSGTYGVAENGAAATKVDTGGTLLVNGATLNVTNGNAASYFPIGNTQTTGTSVFTLTSGTVNILNANGLEVGRNGNGVLNINGGSFTVNDSSSTFQLELGELSTSYGGTVNLNAGTLSANRIYAGDSSALNVFNFNGGTLTALTSGTLLQSGGYTANVRNGGGTINNGGNTIDIAEPLVHSAIAGDNAIDGGMTFSGAGTTKLTGSNTYNGGTTINGADVQISSMSNLGAGTAATISNGGTMEALGPIQTSNNFSLSGNGGFTADSGVLEIDGVISDGAGSGTLIANGAGTIDLTSTSNSYSGGTVINAALVQISTDSSLGASSGPVAINGSTLEVLPGNTSSGSRNFSLSGTATIQIDAGSSYSTFGELSDGGSAGTLVKTGSGTLGVAGVGITGNVNVNGGTLIVSGEVTGFGNTATVNSGATLGGVGPIDGSVDVNPGGTIAPGAGAPFTIGTTLTIDSNLTLSGSANVALTLGNATNVNDKLSVDNLTLDPGNTDTLTLTVLGGLNGPVTYDIADYAGSESGTFFGNIIVNGAVFQSISYGSGTADSIVVTLIPVPEPGTWALMLGGTGMLIGFQRIRRRKF